MNTRWLNEDTWLCQAHLSTVRIPAAAERCWYSGCTSERPAKATAHDMAIAKAREVVDAVRRRALAALTPACPVCGLSGPSGHFCSRTHLEAYARNLVPVHRTAPGSCPVCGLAGTEGRFCSRAHLEIHARNSAR